MKRLLILTALVLTSCSQYRHGPCLVTSAQPVVAYQCPYRLTLWTPGFSISLSIFGIDLSFY